MTDAEGSAPTTVDEARLKVEQTRAELTDTLESVTDKLDVKKQAKLKLRDVNAKVQESTEGLADLAGKVNDNLPPPVRQGIDTTAEAVRPVVTRAMTEAKTRRGQVVIAAAAVILLFVVVRRWRVS